MDIIEAVKMEEVCHERFFSAGMDQLQENTYIGKIERESLNGYSRSVIISSYSSINQR
jgi:hypothetical protein